MLNKIVVILIILLCATATQLYALELGTATVESSVNQPLRVQIELLELGETRLQDVSVQMASNDDFERFNMERADFLSNIQFSAESTSQGNVVVMTAPQMVSEPYLNFILDVRWPNGQLFSEHTLVLDLPVFADQSSDAELRPPISPILQQPETGEAETIAISNGDTLFSIALQVRSDNAVSIQQTMLAIQRLNPEAFAAGNINRMRSGEVLRVPTMEEIEAIDPGDAVAEVARQNQDFAATDVQPLAAPADAASAQDDEPQGQLSVVSADDVIAAADAGRASAENEALDQRITALEMQLDQHQEEAARVRIEREELDSRMQDLAAQIAAAQEIIRLQDIQLAQLQESLAVAAAEQQAIQQAAEVPLNSPSSWLDGVLRALTGNSLFMLLGAALLTLLLLVFLLRRNRTREVAGKNIDEIAEQEFHIIDETVMEDTLENEENEDDTEFQDYDDDDQAEEDLDRETFSFDSEAVTSDETAIDSADTDEDSDEDSEDFDSSPDQFKAEPAEETETEASAAEVPGNDGDVEFLPADEAETEAIEAAEEAETETAEAAEEAETETAETAEEVETETAEAAEEVETETVETAEEAGLLSDDKAETAEEAGLLSDDKAETAEEAGLLSDDKAETAEEAGLLSDDDKVETAEEAGLLSDDDETATKLDLAYAYQKMGDSEGAREILQEVIKEGSGEQIDEASKLLGTLEDNPNPNSNSNPNPNPNPDPDPK